MYHGNGSEILYEDVEFQQQEELVESFWMSIRDCPRHHAAKCSSTLLLIVEDCARSVAVPTLTCAPLADLIVFSVLYQSVKSNFSEYVHFVSLFVGEAGAMTEVPSDGCSTVGACRTVDCVQSLQIDYNYLFATRCLCPYLSVALLAC